MKQEQQVEYTINQSNPGEPNTASSYDPYQSYNVASTQTAGKSTSSVTYTLKTENLIDVPDAHPAEIKQEETAPKNIPRDKQPAADITRPIHWYSTSEPSSTGSYYNQSNPTQNQAPPSTGPKDWNTLQQEQTQKIQEIVAQMTKPKKSKKKKGKKANQTGKPAQNASNPVQKKPPNEQDNAKPIVANNPSSQKPTNTQNSHTNTQKNSNQVEVKKPQTPPQSQLRQSINKKPKPQYKVKEPTPSESEPEPEIKPNDIVSQPANQTQFSKRQNVMRQPKVWKRKDEDENDEQNNN
jgi:hypothetical protein